MPAAATPTPNEFVAYIGGYRGSSRSRSSIRSSNTDNGNSSGSSPTALDDRHNSSHVHNTGERQPLLLELPSDNNKSLYSSISSSSSLSGHISTVVDTTDLVEIQPHDHPQQQQSDLGTVFDDNRMNSYHQYRPSTATASSSFNVRMIPQKQQQQQQQRYRSKQKMVLLMTVSTAVTVMLLTLTASNTTTIWDDENNYSRHGPLDDCDNDIDSWQYPYESSCPLSSSSSQQEPIVSTRGIQMYLHLFDWKFRQGGRPNRTTSSGGVSNQQHGRSLSMVYPVVDDTLPTSTSYSTTETDGSSGSSSGTTRTATQRKTMAPTLVIAGKMTIDGQPCNIGQYNLKTNEWSLSERIQLSLYNSYSGGEVYSLLANHTSTTTTTTTTTGTSSSSSSIYTESSLLPITKKNSNSNTAVSSVTAGGTTTTTTTKQTGSGELLVVGAFDTTYRNSQVTYCSVGMWDGTQLSKVGEGLCNSALSKGMKITTASLAGSQDVYVAGSFQTQVWNGDRHEFVQIFNIAHFNAADQVWLPLNVGQISCSWCTVTVLALAWDRKRRQLHVAGKFNAIDGRNVPAGLAIYDYDSGHLVAHPGGGLSMRNISQDGVATALQLDETRDVLYVMGSYERLTQTYEFCDGLAAYEIEADRWTCLADAEHSVRPTGGGNMLLTQFGLMVAGKTTPSTTWRNPNKPYTIALLNATLVTKTKETRPSKDDDTVVVEEQAYHNFNWSWLPGFSGHEEPLHALSNGFGAYEGSVFIAGDNLVARWAHQPASSSSSSESFDENESDDETNTRRKLISIDSRTTSTAKLIPRTVILNGDTVRGAVMAISQMQPEAIEADAAAPKSSVPMNFQIIVYCVCLGAILGVLGAILCNKNIAGALFSSGNDERGLKGFTLDTLTYSAMENTSMVEAYNRAMHTRYVHHPNLLTVIDPQEIFLQRIIGNGTFGRVWSARWRTASVAVKEFVFAQAAVAGKSSMQQQIVEEIIGEAGMMAILRHPNVLQLFGCSLTAQAIWIVSELCSLGSLRQMLDDNDRVLGLDVRLSLALQVAEGMTYLHNQKIIHRDLKSLNIFVHETFIASDDVSVSSKRPDGSERMESHSTYVAKIGDWGSARATMSGSRTMTHGVGTACWLAPEVIKHARSSKFSDVYGFGIILWELATREEVYQGLETTQIIAKVANENLRPPVPQDCPWKDIMVTCWAENPLDRLEFSEIVDAFTDLKNKCNEEAAESKKSDSIEEVDETPSHDLPNISTGS